MKAFLKVIIAVFRNICISICLTVYVYFSTFFFCWFSHFFYFVSSVVCCFSFLLSLLPIGEIKMNKLCGRPPQYVPAPCKLTFDLLTLKVMSESRVTWATSVPILVFLGLSVLDLGAMYATDRQTDVRRASSLNAPTLGAGE